MVSMYWSDQVQRPLKKWTYKQRIIVSELVHSVPEIFLHNQVCIISHTYCVDSQTRHAIYLHNDCPQGCNHMTNWNTIVQFLECNIWMKNNLHDFITRPSIFFTFTFSKMSIFMHEGHVTMLRQYLFVKITRAYIFVVMKIHEWKIQISVTIHFWIRNK